jgi:hypothetical protein
MTDVPLMKTSLCLRLFTQDVVCFQRYELLRASVHRYVTGYILLVGMIISLLDLRGSLQPLPPGASAIINCISLLIVTAVHLGIVTWHEWRHRGPSLLVLNVSPILMIGTFVGVVTAELQVMLWLGLPRLPLGQAAMLWAFHYFLAEVFIGLVIYLLMPKVLSDLRGVPIRSVADSHRFTPETQTQDTALPTQAGIVPDWAEIGGKRIALSDLLHIEAEGNYIRVTTAQKRLYLPGPFGPVADALPAELGLRVSRSDWVASAAVVALRGERSELRLALTNGIEVPVPKNRRKAVLQWLEEHPAVQWSIEAGGARKGDIDPDRTVM